MDIDELLFDILMVCNENWVTKMSIENYGNENEQQPRINQQMEAKMQHLEKTIQVLNQNGKVQAETIELMMQYIPELRKIKLQAATLTENDDESYDDDDDKDDLPSTV